MLHKKMQKFARFDYGFIKNEFKRMGKTVRAPVLCSVKLSRAFFPEEARHNLDALTARHGLKAAGRHRALADADPFTCSATRSLRMTSVPTRPFELRSMPILEPR